MPSHKVECAAVVARPNNVNRHQALVLTERRNFTGEQVPGLRQDETMDAEFGQFDEPI
ncbi:MAG: hypothetical protein P8L31_11810 [Pseudomonadales bacterium]|nr:hypothetical protein [Pseudomonadales bacterium]